MSLTNYFLNDFAALDRFFDEAFNSYAHHQLRSQNKAAAAFRPWTDVHHDKDTNTITASFELPGLRKEDVTIDLYNDVLTVSGENQSASERSQDGYAIRERRYGKFARSLSLPQGVKSEDIKASMKDGVLHITFPRSVPETEPARISIA